MFNVIVKTFFNKFFLRFPFSDHSIAIFKIGVSTIFYIYVFNHKDSKIINILEDAILYFFEYNSQIKEEKNVFLDLKPQDATTFLYKKHLTLSSSNDGINDETLEFYLKVIEIINSYENEEDFRQKWNQLLCL